MALRAISALAMNLYLGRCRVEAWHKPMLWVLAMTLFLAILAARTLAQSYSSSPVEDATDNTLVSLGERLFRSPLLSADRSVSCETCHIPAFGYSGDRPLPVGVAGYVSSRRAPSLLGLRHARNLMWDGRALDLQSQAAIPLESPEMAVVWPVALSRLRADRTIAEIFERAGITNVDRGSSLTALAAYVASLDAGESRFDRYYYGHEEQALSQQEILGLRLFTHKAHCAGCHLLNGLGAPFTDDSFHAMGIGCTAGSCTDRGRAVITGSPADEGAFKTPGLRAVALRPYLMHDGSISSLRGAVERYNRGIPLGLDKLDGRLGPLHLAADEVDAIVAFLSALTPENLVSRKTSSRLSQDRRSND
jgi:cytochrome c peroxidase